MKIGRIKKTLCALWLATLASWLFIFLMDQTQPISFILFISPPFLLGAALLYSNREYLKGTYSQLIPFLFFLIYFYGTTPFSHVGKLVFNSLFAYNLFGCISAFLLVIVVIKVTMKEVHIGVLQILMIFFLPIICVFLDGFARGRGLSEMNYQIADRLDLTVLIYQFFMSIAIASTLKPDKILSLQTLKVNNKDG